MDALKEMINALSKEEIRHFKIYLSRINTGKERKDEQLFDHIKSSKNFNNDKAALKLNYTEKNAFYRLKNRLQEDICDTLALLHSNKVSTNSLFRELMLFNIFKEKNNLLLSVYFLKRAEKQATEVENLEVLDWIFSNYIKLSNDYPEINPEEYIQKQKNNTEHLNKLRAIDQALAAVIYRLKTAQTFGKKPTELLDLLDKSIKEFSRDNFLKTSKTFQTRLYRAVSQQLLQTNNFLQLEKFMKSTIATFNKNNWFEKGNHDIKLQMQVYLVNALFRNEKYNESIEQAELLGKQILEFNKIHYGKYVFFYYNALYINYSRIDLNKAIKALDELDKVMKELKNSYYEQFILLNKSTLLFEQKKYNEAIRQLVRLYLNESYQNAAETFKLKVSIAELIMQYESGDKKVFKNRVGQVRKDFRLILAKKETIRDKNFLKLMEDLGNGKYNIHKSMNNFLQKFKQEDVENELLNYEKWIESKLKEEKKSFLDK